MTGNCKDAQNPPSDNTRADPPQIGAPVVAPSSSKVPEASPGKKLSEILDKGHRHG